MIRLSLNAGQMYNKNLTACHLQNSCVGVILQSRELETRPLTTDACALEYEAKRTDLDSLKSRIRHHSTDGIRKAMASNGNAVFSAVNAPGFPTMPAPEIIKISQQISIKVMSKCLGFIHSSYIQDLDN